MGPMVAALPAGVLVSAAPPDEGSLPGRQPCDHEVVAVLEQLEDRLVGNRPVEGDRDPVALVEVVAGLDGRIRGAQSFRQVRLAPEADPQRARLERAEREHLAAHLEHRRLLAERELLRRIRAFQAPASQCVRGHAWNLYLSVAATRWAWTTANWPLPT